MFHDNATILLWQAQALQEASKPMEVPASKLQLSEEHAPVKMETDQPNGLHHEVKKEEMPVGADGHVKYEHDEGEPETLDFSPDSFWDVLPDLAPLIASSSGRTPNVRPRSSHQSPFLSPTDFCLVTLQSIVPRMLAMMVCRSTLPRSLCHVACTGGL